MPNIFTQTRGSLREKVTKIVTLPLIAFFVFSPFSALAQDVPDTQTPVSNQSAPVQDTLSPDAPDVTSPAPDTSDTQEQSVDAQSTESFSDTQETIATPDSSDDATKEDKEDDLSKIDPPGPESLSFGEDGGPAVSNASGFAYQNIAPKADGQTGALTQSIQLDIPPGRNGVQPDLKLQYNSQRTEDGIVGYGWSISIPYIERLNKTGSQNIYSPSAYFTSTLDGELATTSNATTTMTFVAKVDDGGQFNAYSFSATTSTWTMYDKNGTRYTFGASDQSQQNAAASNDNLQVDDKRNS